ncbi:MAG: hypothetical protein MJZ50_05250 [Treponema sp.]|nr:hypothetical protein [Treponema sp.]
MNMNANRTVFFFCGPTGSGKTSGIAKLLAPFILNKKFRKQIKIITMDTINVGARNVFYKWGNTLQVEAAACATKKELTEELAVNSRSMYVFVDLSGFSMYETGDLLYIKDICKSVANRSLFLVVPASTSEDSLREMMIAHHKAGLKFSGSILTKIDEAFNNRILKILSEESQYKPVAYIDGREIVDSAKISANIFPDFPAIGSTDDLTPKEESNDGSCRKSFILPQE